MFPLGYVFTHSISLTLEGNYDFFRCSEKSNFKHKYHIRVINIVVQRWSIVYQKNLTKERSLNFHQWKTFSKKYKWNCRWNFSDFIQTQKRYSTLWQNNYSNLNRTYHMKAKYFLWTQLQEFTEKLNYAFWLFLLHFCFTSYILNSLHNWSKNMFCMLVEHILSRHVTWL